MVADDYDFQPTIKQNRPAPLAHLSKKLKAVRALSLYIPG
jgi:hypothetical protein